jgi:xanthine dehydrogenase molybdenum-binding subunit
MAAEQLEIDPLDLELTGGAVRAKGSPDTAVPIAELAGTGTAILGKGSGPVPEAPECNPDSGCLGRLGMESFLEPQLITHAVHVRVDRDTGVVRVLRAAAAHDSGTILNRIGADGQVRGGVVMGIGQALSEGMQLDEAGRQLNPRLLDYKLVTAADAPPIDIAWVQTPAVNGGPSGSKGIGEPPCVPTPGAVANAIAIATGRRVYRLPMTPERVWEAMQ